MRKIVFLVFFTIAILNVWASGQSSVGVGEPSDSLFKVTAIKPVPSFKDKEVTYTARRDFIDFYTVENAQLNCITGKKDVLSSDQYSAADDHRTNHVDFAKNNEHHLSYALVPSQKEFKEVCGA